MYQEEVPGVKTRERLAKYLPSTLQRVINFLFFATLEAPLHRINLLAYIDTAEEERRKTAHPLSLDFSDLRSSIYCAILSTCGEKFVLIFRGEWCGLGGF